jgi:FKBP-type peptidyl-prolyl cis-trans isomerase (trigger factor)
VVIDFVGKVDGVRSKAARPRGSAGTRRGPLIPGFEEQLVGVKADEKTITVTFPG